MTSNHGSPHVRPGLHVSPFPHRQGVPAAAATVALLRAHAHARIPDRSGRGGGAAPVRARSGGRGPGRGRGDLGRLAELLRHLRGAPRSGPGPVPRGLRRHPLQIPGPALFALRVHLGGHRLRHGAGPLPGLPQEARVDLPHPAGHGGAGRDRAFRRADGSAPAWPPTTAGCCTRRSRSGPRASTPASSTPCRCCTIAGCRRSRGTAPTAWTRW